MISPFPFLSANRHRLVALMGLSVAILSLFSLTGCSDGPGDQPELGSVTGVVTLDDKPLANAVVQFIPKAGRPSQGTTDGAGRYTLTYIRDTRGAVIGSHTVKISKETEDPDPSQPGFVPEQLVPTKYNTSTKLNAVVEAGENTLDFPLTGS